MEEKQKEPKITEYLESLHKIVTSIEITRRSLESNDRALSSILESEGFNDAIQSPGFISLDDDMQHPVKMERIKQMHIETLLCQKKLINQIAVCIDSILLSPGADKSEPDTQQPSDPLFARSRKIPLFLIHPDIIHLTNIITHYSRFTYFTLTPCFLLDHLTSQLSSEQNGLVLISRNMIHHDPRSVIRSVRDLNTTIPVIILEPELSSHVHIPEGYAGWIREDCDESDLLSVFFNGLQERTVCNVQTHYQGD